MVEQGKQTMVRMAGTALACGLLLGSVAQGQDVYEGGRGLITLEGPSGLFINPTSGTMPEGASTVQYCIFLPNNETDIVGHGGIAAYGVSDELEVGIQGNYVDTPADGLTAIGPFARYRLLQDSDETPEVSVGAHSRFGDDLDFYGVFAAAYKRFVIDEEGPVRAAGLHVGVRHKWLDDSAAEDTTSAAYVGAEVELPLRVYGVVELSTKDSDINTEQPYAFGLQWRAAGIAMSLAGIQNGNVDDPSFYYGIGWSGAL